MFSIRYFIPKILNRFDILVFNAMINHVYKSLFVTPIVLAIITIFIVASLAHRTLINIWGSLEKSESVYTNDHTYVMHQALKNRGLKQKLVVFIGGSVTREGTLLDRDMQDLYFAKKTDDNIKFLNLGSSDQSLLESLRLLKTINIPPGSIVYIQFSFKKLNYGPIQYKKDIAEPRLPLLSSQDIYNKASYYDHVIYHLTPDLILGKAFWNLFIQNKNCKIRQLFVKNSSCYKDNPVTRSIYKEENRMTLEKKYEYVQNIKNVVYPEFIRSCNFSADLISETVDYVKSQRAIPVLIEYPISTTEYQLYKTAESEVTYQERYKEIASKALVLNLAFEKGFLEEDFFDSQHLLPSGKAKVSSLVMKHITQILNGDIQLL